MRLFVSIDLDGLGGAVTRAQEPFSGIDGLRLVDPDRAHVTLKFLGDTLAGRLPDVEAALSGAVEASGVEPFEARFGGLGVFPDREYISVVWMGVREGGEAMTRLHEAIETRLTDAGFDPEDHEFTPHATVARMDHAGGKERVRDVVENRDPDVGTLRVEEIRLTESELTADGPEYSTVERIPL